jgi:hypothetical protein
MDPSDLAIKALARVLSRTQDKTSQQENISPQGKLPLSIEG